jgi:hypothetical protein
MHGNSCKAEELLPPEENLGSVVLVIQFSQTWHLVLCTGMDMSLGGECSRCEQVWCSEQHLRLLWVRQPGGRLTTYHRRVTGWRMRGVVVYLYSSIRLHGLDSDSFTFTLSYFTCKVKYVSERYCLAQSKLQEGEGHDVAGGVTLCAFHHVLLL